MSASTPLLSLKGITKVFPGVRALENVQLDLWPGKVTALIGENGAGKSTLVKVMTGIYQPEEGEILYKAIPIQLPNPESAHKVGITAIHQETVLFDELSVTENIFVGQYLHRGLLKKLDWPAMHRKASEILTRLEVQIDPRATLKTLSIAQRHMVAIARALSFEAQVVILDEPTAALSQHEILEFYQIVERLKQDGKAILFISHKFDEIFELADYYTILRDGVYVSSGAINDITEERMVAMMVHRRFGADIDAFGRFVEDNHLGMGRQPFADHHFLLIATGKGFHRLPPAKGLNLQARSVLVRQPPFAGVVKHAAGVQFAELRQADVLGDRQGDNRSLLLPLFRHADDTGADRVGRLAKAHRFPLQHNIAGRGM